MWLCAFGAVMSTRCACVRACVCKHLHAPLNGRSPLHVTAPPCLPQLTLSRVELLLGDIITTWWHAAAVSCLVAGWCRWWLSRPSFSYALPPSVAVQQRMLLVCGMGCSCVCMRQRSLSLPMFFMVVMAAHGWVFTSASILCTFPNPGP